MTRLRPLASALALTLSMAGCESSDEPIVQDPSGVGSGSPGGTDTGNPNSGNEGGLGGGNNCEERERHDLSFDQVSDLGFSPSQIWTFSEGEHSIPLRWESQGGVDSGSFEGTETTLHVTLSRKGETAARLVDMEPRADETDGREEGALLGGAIDSPCLDRLELDVEIALSTEDGALDERFDASLSSSDGISASWSTQIAHEALAGSLEVVLGAVPAGSQLQPLVIGMTHTAFAIQGTIGASFEGNDGTAAWHGGATLAQWPEGGGCEWEGVPVAPDARVFDFSAEEVLAALEAYYPSSLTWQGGSKTELEFALALVDGGRICAVPGQRELLADVELSWSSADERIQGSLPLSLRAGADDAGSLAEVSVFHDSYLAATVPPADFEQRFGIRGLELADYDQVGLSWSWNVDLATTTASGALAVLGGIVDPCVTEPPPPPADGSTTGSTTSPGCRGTDFFELEQASF